jgi:hypothetical protein
VSKYRITYRQARKGGTDMETVEAKGYGDTKDGTWIEFTRESGGSARRVLRVRSEDVVRIEMLEDKE